MPCIHTKTPLSRNGWIGNSNKQDLAELLESFFHYLNLKGAESNCVIPPTALDEFSEIRIAIVDIVPGEVMLFSTGTLAKIHTQFVATLI